MPFQTLLFFWHAESTDIACVVLSPTCPPKANVVERPRELRQTTRLRPNMLECNPSRPYVIVTTNFSRFPTRTGNGFSEIRVCVCNPTNSLDAEQNGNRQAVNPPPPVSHTLWAKFTQSPAGQIVATVHIPPRLCAPPHCQRSHTADAHQSRGGQWRGGWGGCLPLGLLPHPLRPGAIAAAQDRHHLVIPRALRG